MEETSVERKSRDANKETSFDGVLSKRRLDILDNPRFKKRFVIKFLRSSLWLVMIGCLTLSLKREGVIVHQTRNQLVESVARSTMVFSNGEGRLL